MRSSCSGHRLLIVDDEEIVRVALKTILDKSGFATDCASTALEGLGLLEQHSYSLVISDHKMPGMCGLTFLAQVKSLCPQTTRVLTTVAFNLAAQIDEINRAEIFQFIIKPWETHTLLETVERGIRKFESTQRNECLQATSLATNRTLAATALDNTVEREQLRQGLNDLKENWFKTLQINLQSCQVLCPWLAREVKQVRRLCQQIAELCDLDATDRELLDISAQLYDVGMASVPQTIATKWRRSPSSLTVAERDIIHQHPIASADLTRFSGPYEAVNEIVRCHHERLDGSGFPEGREADEIPYLARILGLAVALVESPHGMLEALHDCASSPQRWDGQVLEGAERVLHRKVPEFA